MDSILQYLQPSEWRIAKPRVPVDDVESDDAAEPPPEDQVSDRVIAEVATCLWYLKTKYFKQPWGSEDGGGDDPRARRALGRLTRGVDVLKASGVEIDDPTEKRYPEGGENMMRPIQFAPTAGLTFAVVSETVTPLIYRDERLIQRAEVFVATPQEAVEGAPGEPDRVPDGTVARSAALGDQVLDDGLEGIPGVTQGGAEPSVVTAPEDSTRDQAEGTRTESKEGK